jgi:bifunctional ADP-heptose synthase (sugar kinase/adenylyltransferase)
VLRTVADNSLELQLANCRDNQILVAGEAVLDRYVFGETDRISPEAPIPVLTEGPDVDDLIRLVRPEVLVRYGKPSAKTFRACKFIESYGGKLVMAQA